MEEIWRDIVGYESMYQVSNLGRVKSLPRKSYKKNGKLHRTYGDIILKHAQINTGYLFVTLTKKGKCKSYTIHQLVAIAFLNHKVCKYDLVVDHINNVKTDNRVENLQIVTHRENISKDKKGSSKYTGVYWYKPRNKWCAKITINGKKIYLGLFINEEDANLAYQNKLKQIV